MCLQRKPWNFFFQQGVYCQLLHVQEDLVTLYTVSGSVKLLTTLPGSSSNVGFRRNVIEMRRQAFSGSPCRQSSFVGGHMA